jgi:hypothetical protein
MAERVTQMNTVARRWNEKCGKNKERDIMVLRGRTSMLLKYFSLFNVFHVNWIEINNCY